MFFFLSEQQFKYQDILFTIIYKTEKLEQVNVWHFCLINDNFRAATNDYFIISELIYSLIYKMVKNVHRNFQGDIFKCLLLSHQQFTMK